MREVIWHLYENAITVLQVFLLVEFVTRIYGVKYWKRIPIITKMIGTAVFAVTVIATNYIVGFEGFGVIGFCVILILYAVFLLEGKWYSKVPIVMIETMLIIFASTAMSLLVCVITGIDGTRLADTICIERAVCLLLVQAVLAICLKAIEGVMKKKWSPLVLNKSEGKVFALIFFVSIAVFFCITQTVFTQELSDGNKNRLLCSCGGLIVLNVVCFRMLEDLVKKRKVETENLLLKEQALYQERYAKEVKQQYDEIKRLRHDMKQQYSVLENLLVQKKYPLIKEYLDKSIQSIKSKNSFVYIKNEYINAILNRKINHARENGIEVVLNSTEEFVGIDEMDMCNLIGNMFDNAREACEKVTGKRSIELSLSQDADKIHVEMKNTIKESVLKENRELKSNKSSRGEHGYGMKTIYEIAEKYAGFVDIWEESGEFCIGLVLYVDK